MKVKIMKKMNRNIKKLFRTEGENERTIFIKENFSNDGENFEENLIRFKNSDGKLIEYLYIYDEKSEDKFKFKKFINKKETNDLSNSEKKMFNNIALSSVIQDILKNEINDYYYLVNGEIKEFESDKKSICNEEMFKEYLNKNLDKIIKEADERDF